MDESGMHGLDLLIQWDVEGDDNCEGCDYR